MMITLAHCVQEICTHPFFIVLGEAKDCHFNTFSIRTGGATLKHNICRYHQTHTVYSW